MTTTKGRFNISIASECREKRNRKTRVDVTKIIILGDGLCLFDGVCQECGHHLVNTGFTEPELEALSILKVIPAKAHKVLA